MSYLALYRKYRPTSFDDFYGQKFIVDVIKNSINNNKISHAYLFSGPRGTGKTSMAKLIAKLINCENLNHLNPCNKCNSCKLINDKSNPDIVEIDAASNNGVDEIRELRDKVSLMPTVSRFKVYIIDEVHMLTISAFNALLKTLEEPPSHVIFILATTELYKVPETIVSRCQTFEFERISEVEIKKCLNNIVRKEKLTVDDDVLNLIADYSKGGLRDSIGLLDKLSACSNVINKDLFYDVVGVVSEKNVHKVLELIKNRDIINLFKKLEKISKEGKNILYFIEQLMSQIKTNILNNKNVDNSDLIILNGLNDIFVNIKFSFNYLLSFEVGLLSIINMLSDEDQIISREIILDKAVDEEVSEKNIIETEKSGNLKDKKEKNEHIFVDKIGINNAFALADKTLKQKMLKDWKNFNNYVHNKEFSSIVSYFLDSSLEVAGRKDIIISVPNLAVVTNANYNKPKLELLFNLVFGEFYNLVFVTTEYFEELKNKYISDVKKGKKYEYIEKESQNDDIIEKKSSDNSDAYETAKNVFGSDIVEMK